MFAELHTHNDVGSNTRLIDSTCKVEAIIDKAVEYGYRGVAITDHESLSAHIKALNKMDSVKQEHPDFKLILGNEIYLISDEDYKNTNDFYHFILLAKDAIGHRQLRELSTRAWSRVYTYKRVERVPTFYSDLKEIVGENPGHLIASTACLGGFFPKSILLEVLYNEKSRAYSFANSMRNLFGEDNFFIELQPGLTEEQIAFNKAAIKFCKQYGFQWIITNDVHYLTKEKKTLHAAFLASKDEDRETDSFYESTYMKTEDEMLERMSYLEKEDILQGFKNTVHICDMVEDYDLRRTVVVPNWPLPEFNLLGTFSAHYSRYKYINLFAHSIYEQDRFFLYLIEKGFKERPRVYQRLTDKEGHVYFIAENAKVEDGFTAERYEISLETALKRINVELQQIWEISSKLNQRLSAYYNLVRMLVDLMWDDNRGDSLVGVSRGSVTGYYTAYLIGIIQVNPILYDLPYYRHLVFQRPELPDKVI